MGTGKTKRLLTHLEKHYAPGAFGGQILYVTFRRSLARWAGEQLARQGFVLYSDLEGRLSPERTPRLVIQVESLGRLETRGAPPPALVILDESESIMAQLGSGLARNQARTLAVFEWLVRRAESVICLDAHLGERTARVIGQMRTKLKLSLRLIHNCWAAGRGETYRLTSSHPLWLQALLTSVDAGNRVVIPTNSLAEAESLEHLLRGRIVRRRRHASAGGSFDSSDRTLKILSYTSRTCGRVRARDLKNVDLAWTGADVLIYTPTISAGISYEQSGFDEVFAVFTNDSCDALAAVQMLGRVRQISRRRFTICVRGAAPTPALPTDEVALAEVLDRRQSALFGTQSAPPAYELDDDGTLRLPKTAQFTLWCANQIVANRSRNNYAGILSELLSQRGGDVELLAPTCREDEIRAMRALARASRAGASHEEATAVANAQELTTDQALRLRDAVRRTAGEMTGDVRLALAKHGLRIMYRRLIVGLDPEWVEAYSAPNIRRMFRDIAAIAACATHDDLTNFSQRQEAEIIVRAGGVCSGPVWEEAVFERVIGGAGRWALRFSLYMWAAESLGLYCGKGSPSDEILGGVIEPWDKSATARRVITPDHLRAAVAKGATRLAWASRAANDAGLGTLVLKLPATLAQWSEVAGITGPGLSALGLARAVLMCGLGLTLYVRQGGVVLWQTPTGRKIRLAPSPSGQPTDRPFVVVAKEARLLAKEPTLPQNL
jgi:hypothetical protein